MYQIAIVGASTLLGKELKEALTESPLASSNVLLMDEEDALGQLDQVGDEIAFIQAVEADSFDKVDFTFFAGSEDLTRKHWRAALRAGSTVLDLTGALEQEPGVLVRATWLAAEPGTPDLYTPAVVPAHPAALALALLMERLTMAATVRFEAATVLLPASEFGRTAMDELHQQTLNLLSFQSLPRAIFDAQAAYNVLCGFGESATANLAAVNTRIRRHYAALADRNWPALGLQVASAPVFHGHVFSIALEFEHPVEIATLEDALSGERLDLVLEDTDSPSNLAATGQNDVLVRLRPEKDHRNPNLTSRIWLWAASDNLRLCALNAVDCALDLRRLRPAGTVQ